MLQSQQLHGDPFELNVEPFKFDWQPTTYTTTSERSFDPEVFTNIVDSTANATANIINAVKGNRAIQNQLQQGNAVTIPVGSGAIDTKLVLLLGAGVVSAVVLSKFLGK